MQLVFKDRSKSLVIFLLVFFLFQCFLPRGAKAGELKLVIDGRRIEAEPAPFLEGGRTLVPVRLVSEELGADVDWDEVNRTVHIKKGGREVLLRIDSRLVAYKQQGERVYGLSDVAPRIRDGRTFVPVRLVSNALGVAVDWEAASRTVVVDSRQAAGITPFYSLEIATLQPGQVITGATRLQTVFPDGLPAGAAEIKYLLLHPETGRGRVVARGSNPTAAYQWLPDLEERGERVLVAAVYDGAGNFLAGTALGVQVAVEPRVSLTGVTPGGLIKDTVTLGAEVNFAPAYVKYEIVNQDTGKAFVTEEADPFGPFSWTPMLEDKGSVTFRVTAYDQGGRAYPSQPVTALVAPEPSLGLRGVKEGETITKPVNLLASRNFPVSRTEFVLRDPRTGQEKILAQIPYGGYRWFPGPEEAGSKEVLVRVVDPAGKTHTSPPVRVEISAQPLLLLEGVGPNQVVTGPVELSVTSNVPLTGVQFYLINPKTGARQAIAGGNDPGAKYTWTPAAEGQWHLQAEGTTAAGQRVTSEGVPFRVYLGELYAARPVVEKDKFLDLAAGLASQSWQKTGMSAALQTAQAILETGWGQSVPVDKYTGKFSFNLFGIKGTGPAGSVISNTWEEYNGQTYRVDANFRAYNSIEESWADHKELLLTASRYEPFRAVMHDSTQGAWALKRAGYATDSKYPLKLMDIIRRYDLQKLDEVKI
ncbi:MAG: glucosaminidase domain-containing protein [bacterium]|jgi:hypothetical protein